ncbi:small GTP-binding protein, putative [Trichomonas vaginalis G3]|uniref:Small GTP-binding protein, putative n=1 Tax=Trichomonas vaginalis (strain ATCC PRA-98 / G3) TaxID=412133 RepID=A2DL60_TRIV3|nr:retrograde vesicle-mediated transport, Golgi to ER [Trichomonas vaginalis G3]EAY18851.1 small GTP-binding protein, putative [Trichomonas vaginalis G3]KAI5526043.1 retrograde vesicle-mediated transport, Golgi to ER [Trichomonas vaginalis G3]|eukprot:XP_001579837.1 small GTP-binding protein [Trichomonas vaginalis G3]
MKVKIVLLGPMSVGKTALCNRFKYDKFEQNYQVTIGAGIIDYQTKVNGKSVDVQIWDTAGMERHRSLSPLYYRDADAGIFVYDISEKGSINQLERFYDEFMAQNDRGFHGIVVANKSDLNKNEAALEEGNKWATMHGCEFTTASAKIGEGVAEAFNKAIMGAVLRSTNTATKSIILKNADDDEKKGCC